MTPAELVEAIPDAAVGVEFDDTTVDVPVAAWVSAARTLRERGYGYLDLLTAWETEDGYAVALQVWSTASRHRVRLVCRVESVLPTLTGVYPGVDWHERETAEMFGLDFAGHPNLVPLLLPDPVITLAPLRKAFVLPAREARPWPGEVEP